MLSNTRYLFNIYVLMIMCLYFLSMSHSLLNNDYLPDRLDLLDPNFKDSIAYQEFIANQKRKNDFSFIVKIFKIIFRG
mgnify:CR=1 FL=1